MAGYKLTASLLNRWKVPGKRTDGLALSFLRNKDGTLSAVQRVKGPDGKESDRRVATVSGEITQEHLNAIRAKGYALKAAVKASQERQEAVTFEKAWDDFYMAVTSAENPKWTELSARQVKARMLRYVATTPLWTMPVVDIRSTDVERAMETVRGLKPKLAPKLLNHIGQVISYAAHDLNIDTNPARVFREKLKSAEKPVKFNKLPAIVTWDGLGSLLYAIETSTLYPSTRWALVLQAYTAQRSGTVARARWSDFDLAAGIWTIPREQMKISDTSIKPHDHRLVLPASVMELIQRIPRKGDYLFVPRHGESEHISVEAFSQSFARLGFRGIAVPHGWRSSVKTLANDAVDEDGRPLFAPRWVEDLLDHTVQGIEGHYTRAQAEKGIARVLEWWVSNLQLAFNKHKTQ